MNACLCYDAGVAVGGEDRDSSSGAQLATLSDYISHLER